jgi:hypothetical protein
MLKHIPSFQDISDWNKKPYSNTGGTRSKMIYIKSESEIEYFFKCSKELKDGSIKYPFEYWSEITASKIGQYLGFDLLDYNIGYDKYAIQKIGCLSESMILHPENRLTEGIDYIRGFDPKYDPSNDENRYNIKLIYNALDFFNLSEHKDKILEMIIFDGLIGNSDRHQENWGFITKIKETLSELDRDIANSNFVLKRFILKFKKLITTGLLSNQFSYEKQLDDNTRRISLLNQSSIAITEFSQIYDSGCSLGRELEEERISKMLLDDNLILKYILNGKSEVRWNEGKKIKHFDLLKILKKENIQLFKDIQSRVKHKYNESDIDSIIQHIDINLPKELFYFKLPENRKKLMLKVVDLRVKQFLNI